MKNIHETVWLQIGEEDNETDIDFNELMVSWSSVRIDDSDLEYQLVKKIKEKLIESL